MAKLYKDIYDKKREWAANRMAENKKIKTLTDEQHDALANLASMRHEIHTDQLSMYNTESANFSKYWNWIDFEINEMLKEVKLPKLKFMAETSEPPLDTDGQEGIIEYTDEAEEENKQEALKNIEQINRDIEDYLYDIDKKHKTNYAPSGASRLGNTHNINKNHPMTITKSNYLSEAPKYASKFPPALKAGHEVITDLQAAGFDITEKTGEADIDETVELQIQKLNEWIKANEVKDDKTKTSPPAPLQVERGAKPKKVATSTKKPANFDTLKSVFSSLKFNNKGSYIPSSANDQKYIIKKAKDKGHDIEVVEFVNDGTDLYDVYIKLKPKKVASSTKKVASSKPNLTPSPSPGGEGDKAPKKVTKSKPKTAKPTTDNRKPTPPKPPIQVTKLSAELQIIKNILALNGKKRTVVYITRLKDQAERAIAYGALHHAADVQEGIRILNKIIAKAEEDKSTHMIVTFKEDTISDLKSTLSKAKVRVQFQYLAGVKKKEQEERAARQSLTPSLSKGEGVGTINTPRLTPEERGTELEPTAPPLPSPEGDGVKTLNSKPSTVNRKPSNKNAPAHLQSLIKKSSVLGTEYDPEFFEIPNKDMSMFLGKVERKPFHSVVMTLDAPEGAGKTRACFQMAKAFAEANYKVLFVTLEEHGESSLFTDKRDEYWNAQDQKRIDVIYELPNGVETLVELSELYDVIVTDSWQKVDDGDAKLDDYRKSVDGKLLIIIFQRTTDNKMRGGSKSKFDADMVGKLYKSPDGDYKKNYVYWDKNRYNKQNMVFLITEGIALNRETFVSDPSESTKK